MVGAVTSPGARPAFCSAASRWPTEIRHRRPPLHLVLLGGCVLALVPAFCLLGSGRVPRRSFAVTARWRGFGLDELSAWFLFVVLGVGAALAAYGVPYLSRSGSAGTSARAPAPRRVDRGHGRGGDCANGVAFLACWEVMAVAAYFLVIFEHDRPGVWDAGMIYLVLTHASTLALIGMFAVWARGGAGRSFEDLARAGSANLVPCTWCWLSLLGFGIKAGVFPFHFWLPGAHAAAPSHVSALLSGVMLKIGIYGLLRILDLLGSPPAWWGWTVLALGLASAVLGVLWALAQHDIKRLLAYHSVENIGIILLGLGLGALGTAYHQPAVALLGYAELCSTRSTTRCSRACCSWARGRWCTRPARARSTGWAASRAACRARRRCSSSARPRSSGCLRSTGS